VDGIRDPQNDYIILKFNRKRTVPITVFLRALAAVDDGTSIRLSSTGTDEEIISLFRDVDNNPERMFITSTLRQEPEWELSGGLTIAEAALIEFFKKMRPGDPATLENARNSSKSNCSTSATTTSSALAATNLTRNLT
jgi:DNA-directed RNA polymerase subunit beta